MGLMMPIVQLLLWPVWNLTELVGAEWFHQIGSFISTFYDVQSYRCCAAVSREVVPAPLAKASPGASQKL